MRETEIGLLAAGSTVMVTGVFRESSDQSGNFSDGLDSLDGDSSHSYDILPDMDYGEQCQRGGLSTQVHGTLKDKVIKLEVIISVSSGC